MTCASELRAQSHITHLQGIIQSGMQPSSVQPGGGVAVGPTNHIAHLQGIIQSGMQPSSVQPGGGVAVGPTNHITRLQGIIQSGNYQFQLYRCDDTANANCAATAWLLPWSNRRAIRSPFTGRLAELSAQEQSACYWSFRPAVFESVGRRSEIVEELLFLCVLDKHSSGRPGAPGEAISHFAPDLLSGV